MSAPPDLLQEAVQVADAVLVGLSDALEDGQISPAGVVAGLQYALHKATSGAIAAQLDLSGVADTVQRLTAAVDAAAITKGTVQ